MRALMPARDDGQLLQKWVDVNKRCGSFFTGLADGKEAPGEEQVGIALLLLDLALALRQRADRSKPET